MQKIWFDTRHTIQYLPPRLGASSEILRVYSFKMNTGVLFVWGSYFAILTPGLGTLDSLLAVLGRPYGMLGFRSMQGKCSHRCTVALAPLFSLVRYFLAWYLPWTLQIAASGTKASEKKAGCFWRETPPPSGHTCELQRNRKAGTTKTIDDWYR